MATYYERSLGTILVEVGVERTRQERLKASGRFRYTCADPEMPTGDKIACLGEEFGEVCRAVVELHAMATDLHGVELRKELVQVAAVAVAWIEAIDKEAR